MMKVNNFKNDTYDKSDKNVNIQLTDELIGNGLTSEEVRHLTECGMVNEAVKNQSKTIGEIIASNLFTYFNLIFAIFSVLLILVRSYVNMTFLPIIICNIFIGIIQEIRSKQVLDRLTLISEPKTEVLRDGSVKTIPSEELVKYDICFFSAGGQICADAMVAEGGVRVNESLITGEADEIVKYKGDKLYSGSYVVSGKCKAVLENVGLNSYAAKLALEAKTSRKRQQTEMMNSLNKLVEVIGILIIPIGIIMFVQEYFWMGVSVKDSVVAVIAALVGMIPEGLYLLASVALVVSVMRLGKKNVLVHEMVCVETLARVNVLCVDKTGTITENKMAVQQIVPFDNYDNDKPLHSIIGDVVNNFDEDNVTMKTLKEYFKNDDYETAKKVFPFSSEVKYSAAVFNDKTYVIGAPEKLLLEQYMEYEADIQQFAKDGSRVLLFGEYKGDMQGRPLEKPVIPYAMIVLANPIRPEARETFDYFEKQGVEIKVISGDNPVTVSNVAKEAGITNAEKYIDASILGTDEKLDKAAMEYTVFGRVQPEQKKKLVDALKRHDKVVAMTGDGVNDVLALKSADCSIAMASGSEAASNASQIVLLDSDFSCMPSVVLEGRRVVNNIQRTASLFLVKNIFSMLMALFSIFTLSKYPLYPTQLSLLGTFTIGIPAFFLALQPNKSIIKGHFLKNVVVKALPAGLADFFTVAAVAIMGSVDNIPHDQLSTIATLVLISVGMAALIRICRPFDVLRMCICTAMIMGISISISFFKKMFAIAHLDGEQWLVTVGLMVISIIVFIIWCKVIGFFEKKDIKLKFRKRKAGCNN